MAVTGCKEQVQRPSERCARGRTSASYPQGPPAVVVLAADEYERLLRLDRADAPALGELLTQIPQDDQDFERISVPARPFTG